MSHGTLLGLNHILESHFFLLPSTSVSISFPDELYEATLEITKILESRLRELCQEIPHGIPAKHKNLWKPISYLQETRLCQECSDTKAAFC